MLNNKKKSISNGQQSPPWENEEMVRKPYTQPNLTVLGDLKSLTLGGSVGPGDIANGSGAPGWP